MLYIEKREYLGPTQIFGVADSGNIYLRFNKDSCKWVLNFNEQLLVLNTDMQFRIGYSHNKRR